MECAWPCNFFHYSVGISGFFFLVVPQPVLKKKQKAVSSIEEFRKELSKNLNQVTETLTALNQIAKTGEGDLYKPYKKFCKTTGPYNRKLAQYE